MINIPGYTIHDKLGVGGMATVYRATQDSLQREVALKVMSNLESQVSSFRQRFIHEGRDLASLQHPNIATIYDISSTGEYNYYAMELLKKGSLSDRLAEGVSLVDSFKIIIQIGHALECAHQNNIIHRDLKPSNILFRDYRTPILTDFGIAKNIERDTQLTKTGALLGTPWYMSPEQCRGLSIDSRSDQYSLCILFYELITGELPFDAEDSIAVAMKQVTDPVPELPESLVALQPIINIALDKDPRQRFSSTAEFCRVLNDMLEGEDSLQSHMNDMTQKVTSEIVNQTPFRNLNESINELDDVAPSQLDIPTEEEFWGERGRLRMWLLSILLLTGLGYAGQFYYNNYYQAQPVTEKERFIPVLIRTAERQIAVSQLLRPAGNNAYETLSKVIKMDPNHQTALQMLDDIATTYEINARESLAQKDYKKTKVHIDRGLKFSQSHIGLLSVQKLLEAELFEIEKQNTIKKKLAKIESHLKKQAYFQPADNNALQEINNILILDKANPIALQRKSEVEKLVEQQIQSLMNRREFSQLDSQLKLVLSHYPQNNYLNQIRRTLDDITQQKKLEAKISALLAQGKARFKRENFAITSGITAQDSFKQVLKLSPQHPEAMDYLEKIANEYLRQAELLFKKKQYSTALLLVDNGFQAVPKHRGLESLSAQISEKIEAENDATKKLLVESVKLIESGNIITPPDENAFLLLQQIVNKNPRDKAARQLLMAIPNKVHGQINQLLTEHKFQLAQRIHKISLNRFPENKALKNLADDIQQEKKRYQMEVKLTETRKQLALLIDNERATLKQLRQILVLIETASIEHSKQLPIDKSIAYFTSQVEARFNPKISLSELDNLSSIISDALNLREKLGSADTREDLSAKQQAIAEMRKVRIENLKVSVRINARPWAEIIRVIDKKGKEISLGDDKTTPVTLNLLPGSYQLVLTNPSYKKHKTYDFDVTENGMSLVDIAFERLTAKRFFETVNY